MQNGLDVHSLIHNPRWVNVSVGFRLKRLALAMTSGPSGAPARPGAPVRKHWSMHKHCFRKMAGAGPSGSGNSKLLGRFRGEEFPTAASSGVFTAAPEPPADP